MEIENYVWHGDEEGKNLLITGAVHGNEICGAGALYWLKEQIDAGLVKIKKGNLTIIPICNRKAYDAGTRYFDRDLNRRFYPKEVIETYEDEVCNAIAPILEETDILLDLHSYHTDGKPFVFVRPSHEGEVALAGMLGVSTYFCGFADAYKKAGIEKSERESMGLPEYTRLCGGYGVTLECGYHKNPKSLEVAKGAVLGALYHLGVADIDTSLNNLLPQKDFVDNGDLYRMIEVFYKKKEGRLESLAHLEKIYKGKLMACYEDGTKIDAPYDSFAIFPKSDAKVGEEWFYLAELIKKA